MFVSRLFRLRTCFEAVLLCFAAAAIPQLAAQSPPPSSLSGPPQTTSSDKPIAAAVRDSKTENKSRAKRVFTDDDMEAVTGPLPRLKMDGIDNSDQIITAIGEYKKTHAPEEVEHAVHDWYEEYDDQLAAAIQDNLNRQILMQENQANGYDLCRQGGDYEKCAKRQTSEAVGARNDQATISRNNALIHRLQNAFTKIRNGLGQYGLRYSWFKVRTTNNIDSL